MPAEHVQQRFAPSRLGLIMLPFCAVFAGLVVLGASQVGAGDATVSAVAGALLVIDLLFAVGLVRTAFLATTLTTDRLVVPRLAAPARVIPLAEIAGVGLRFVANGQGSGWRMMLWRAEGRAIWIPIKPINFSAPRGQRRLRRVDRPALDWQYLQDSPAGQASTAIYRQALAVQGPGGLLATRDRQATADSAGGFETAFWSPDGRTGALPGSGRAFSS